MSYTRVYAFINLRLLFGVSLSPLTNDLQSDTASGAELTGAYVYRGHNQMPSERSSTVKNWVLCTHDTQSIHSECV
jgi:hypothetical protein